MATQSENKKQNLVLGRVVDKLNHPLANLIVQAYDRDMRSEELLGESITNKDGKYEITWSPGQLSGPEKKTADLSMKVFSREKKTLLYTSDMDAIRFNASEKEEINITITINTAIQPEIVEFDYILKEVSLLAGQVAVTDLQETNEHRDITFLSKETEIPAEKIEYLVVAHRLYAASKIDAAFFYALLRKNTLLKNDFVTSYHARLVIDINTEILPLLYDAALTDVKTIQRDVTAAVKEMIVPARAVKEWKKNAELLQQYKQQAEDYYKNEQPKKVLDMVSRFVLNDRIAEMGRIFQENKNDLNAFFRKITDASFFKSDETAVDAETSLALGQLLGFDDLIISQVKESQQIEKPGDVKKLAALNKAGWKEVLTQSADKMNIAGKPLDKKLIDLHASSLVRKMEKEFPTEAFKAQLARETKPIFNNRQAIGDFFAGHEEFDLQRHNIDLFFKEKNLTADTNMAMKEELKSVQRVFKLVPHYSKTNALRQQDIHSAQSIVAAGKTRFVKEIAPKAGITAKEAKEIFNKAEQTHTAAMLIVGELQDTMRAMNVPAMEMNTLALKLEAVSNDFPNLKTLFNLTDVCACDHCRSVYSPAAYLVEILQFLDKRNVVDITVPPPPPPAVRPTLKIAKDVLFERRPDLGEIDLGCENANTPVPYIDLVCELLEEAVAPDAGINFVGDILADPTKNTGLISEALLKALTVLLPEPQRIPVTDKALIFETETVASSAVIPPHYLRDKEAVCKIINNGGHNWTIFRLHQTLSSAEELAAAPEYVNENAYAALENSEYAFKLPFDLEHTEAKAYFSRFDISRAQLMKDFQSAGNPPDKAIAAEKLGLTNRERELIIKQHDNIQDQQQYWNAPSQWAAPIGETPANVSGNVVDYMKRVDHFLDKTGLTYKELDLLLALKFIESGTNLFIKHNYDDPTAPNPTISCDTAKKEIPNLDEAALDRIHRFLRLQKKTGWKFEVLDEIISQAKLGNVILDDACLIKAAGMVALSEETGIKIDQLTGFYGEIPHEIFNDNATTPLYHQIFLNKAKNGIIDEGLLPGKVDGSQLLSAFQTSLSVCLQISEQDLDKLLPLLPDGKLTFSNLSYLFAASRLMKKLKLKADDFTILVKLMGMDIQASPQVTLAFVKAVQTSQSFPLKPADIRFMLFHEAVNLAEREITKDGIKQALKKLQKDYQDNFNANKSPYDDKLSADEQKETLGNALSKLSGVGEEDVRTFIEYINGDWTTDIIAKEFIDNKLNSLFNTDSIKSAVDELKNALPTRTQAISEHENALLALKNAQDALAEATTPAETASAQAQIAAAEAQLLITLPKFNIATGKNLIKAYLDSIATYQFQVGKQSILEQFLAKMFKADLELIKIILRYALLKRVAPIEPISHLLQTDNLIDKVNANPILPTITQGAFLKQFQSFRLLHKLIPLINSFKLENHDIEWFFKNNTGLGWFVWDSIPYKAGQTGIAYAQYASFVEMISLSKQLTPVPDPADAEHPVTFFTTAEILLLPASVTTKNKFIETFSLLTGYNKDDVAAIDAHLFPGVVNLNRYRDIETWKAIGTCAEHLRKLGSTVAQVTENIKPVLTNIDTNRLRSALKSRYDEDTWLSTLKEIMDALRPQKRNALVAYLLAVNPQIKNENDLYDYFLVDVKMEACMPSSRIVLAHGTVQLFVQRCLMGLEPKAAADVDNDRGWEQWKWMKNYRVWEANRKVFLYPENWIEPELRDDKSFLFTELENELMQNELTEFTAEEALIKYLEKLDNIAFLEVVATWYQWDIKTMHVFARTKGGDPSIYYYRKFEQERYWTPWEKVELDITGDHLLAFARNNRLTLAWPVFSEEPDPNPKAKIPGQGTDTPQPIDKPLKKLKMQLAISEFANKKWQPKKISKDAIKTPDYTADDIPRSNLKFFYNELAQQVVVVNRQVNPTNDLSNGEMLCGAFNITGCKGYPELAPAQSFNLDFIPSFLDTQLINHRYKELDLDSTNDLSVQNVHSFFMNRPFDQILKETPGTFRLTYPHQFTKIDIFAFNYQYLLSFAQSMYNVPADYHYNGAMKIPLGTLLPYFKEDSYHAYVIIPGFYKQEKDRETGKPVYIKRTASDVIPLLEDIIALFNIYIADYKANPKQSIDVLIRKLKADNDYQEIINELKMYKSLPYGEQFKNMYHPLVCPLKKILYKDGVAGLMKRDTQLLVNTLFKFDMHYKPTEIVPQLHPVEDIDFNSDGSYSSYNWELFFHVPFLLATRLTKNQRFEEAMTWFHYMFNPTGALPGTAPQKYWVTKPFYLTQGSDYIAQRIDTLLYRIADPTTPEKAELEFAIEQWRNKPFKPHVIARFRPVAYQKALLMKYIDNLTEWGDYLFRQDTMESIVQATQMYIMADKLLGPKPRMIPPAIKAPYETYNQLEAKMDAFGNALIDLENILPDLSVLPEQGAELPPPPITLSMLYFGIPPNDRMLEYWDRIADRLFKIRHCQNIDGIERSLALFEPPIDPGMLVRAAAAGLDISSILAGINAPTPYYRFNVLSQKASELANEVRGLGSSMLQALEKRDAEAMALLRSELEIKVLNAVKDMKLLQIKEAKEQIEVLKRTKRVTEERHKYYSSIQKIISNEQLNLDKLEDAKNWQLAANITYALGACLALIPDFALGISGFGGSPHGAAHFGGSLLAHSTDAIGKTLSIFSAIASYEANRASILGGYERRYDDWKLQERLAKLELNSIDKQIVAAEIRKEIAETDLKNHNLQIENAKKTDEFMRSKFTNKELYDWMIGQISSVYFRAYQLAHDFAKKAERSYRFELGNDDTFISYGYWDSMKKGLQSADHLIHDIKRMETSYLDKNKREYEITKHVSLALLDPLALVRLRATGVCDFEIPEAFYDMDHAGHYFRRNKSVGISLPCIAGPYTSVSAKLSLVSNKYRKNPLPAEPYNEDPSNEPRFVYNVGAIQSIATSNAQNDSGVFELNFRDERYLPFEGTGAISSWRLELPQAVRQFDYNTISDVVLHIKYTAREGGSTLKKAAEDSLKVRLEEIKQQLNQTGLHIAINMKHDLPNEWHLFKKNGTISLTLDKSRLPYMAQTMNAAIADVVFIARVKGNPATFSINVDGVPTNLSIITEWELLWGKSTDIDLNKSFELSIPPLPPVPTTPPAPPTQLENLEELMLVVKYSF